MSLHFDNIVYGPIKSRRLGNSLGVNLLPKHGKLCSFDCVYCECGWNKDGRKDSQLPSLEEVREALKAGLEHCKSSNIQIDTITFSGNGEPTIHPDFPEIIDYVITLRDKLFPQAKISSFSNCTQLHRPGIKEALAKTDNPILKLDSGIESIAELIDRPQSNYSIEDIVEQLKWFKGNFVLQTMFLKGEINGRFIDCTDPETAAPWVKIVLELHPREVMIYTLDRVPPLSTLEKVTVERMRAVSQPLIDAGIEVQIRG